jgi:large subunit ribosomal protein L5
VSKSDVVKAASNPMQRPRISKVVVNMSIGKSGEPLQKAIAVLEQLSGQKPCTRGAKKTIREWGIVKGRPIASIVTLRRDKANDFLKKAFEAVGNRLPKSTFDSNGNFSFGIKEHIQMPGVRYDPALGIFGMDVCITVEKPSYRVKRRCSYKSKVGNRQKITRGEAMGYIREVFDVELV